MNDDLTCSVFGSRSRAGALLHGRVAVGDVRAGVPDDQARHVADGGAGAGALAARHPPQRRLPAPAAAAGPRAARGAPALTPHAAAAAPQPAAGAAPRQQPRPRLHRPLLRGLQRTYLPPTRPNEGGLYKIISMNFTYLHVSRGQYFVYYVQ